MYSFDTSKLYVGKSLFHLFNTLNKFLPTYSVFKSLGSKIVGNSWQLLKVPTTPCKVNIYWTKKNRNINKAAYYFNKSNEFPNSFCISFMNFSESTNKNQHTMHQNERIVYLICSRTLITEKIEVCFPINPKCFHFF